MVCGPLDVTDPALDLLKRYLQFSRFADEVLSRHNNFNSLTRFRFRFSVDGKGRFWWVGSDYRFKRESVFGPPIEEIDVVMPGKAELGIPESFYTSKNLRVVKLERVILNAAAGSVFLPSLKILQLANVKIKDFESLGRLISGCPVLETLCLKSCYPSNYNGEDRIEVSLPSLKNLKICDSDIVEYICPIEIESPNLEDIYLHRFTELQFKGSSSLPCLDSAYVDFGFKCKTSYHDLIQLLARFSNATKMCLTGSALLHMSGFHDVHFPVFPKLTHLTIGMGGRSRVLHSLLSSASKLQSLVIDLEYHTGPATVWEDLETACTPECLLSSLEVIEIKDLVWQEGDWNIIVHLVNTGVVLKKVNVHLKSCDHEAWGRTALAVLLKQSGGLRGHEARLFLPNNKEIRISSDGEINNEVDKKEGGPGSMMVVNRKERLTCPDELSLVTLVNISDDMNS